MLACEGSMCHPKAERKRKKKDGYRLRQPVQADPQPKSSGLVLVRWPLGAVLHSSNNMGELSQWLCHDDSTINIVLELLLCIIIMYVVLILASSTTKDNLTN